MSSRIHAPGRVKWSVPPRGRVFRYLFSSAQNNTRVHPQVWENLKALAIHYGAGLHVSTYLYDRTSHRATDKSRPNGNRRQEEVWYDPVLTPYLLNESVQIAPNLVFCGELNILPTAKRPISGFETYTGRDSCIIPHAKFAMESVCSGKREATKLVYTTGTTTQRNYIAKKAGQVANFHHGYGAVIVEVDSNGHWWVRQLNADNSGTIHDLTLRVKNGVVTDGHAVELISWGDTHIRQADPMVAQIAWGEGGMLDVLKAKRQIFHDLLDFKSRNHHDVNNGRLRFQRFCSQDQEDDDVMAELREAAKALQDRSRPWCKSVVVASNHDAALQRWLDSADYRHDPKNAITFLELQLASYKAIVRRDKNFDIFEHAMLAAGAPKNVKFLREDDSYAVKGVECGHHGHLGLNGGRGSVIGFSRMGCKMIVGHSHSAAIVDGVYMSGTSSLLDLGYNRGPSSWSHSHTLVYGNGKRTIVTFWAGKWRA